MAKHIENIVIGKIEAFPEELFAFDLEDWEKIEKEKTLFTEERYLPKILVEAGICPSTSEVRRNRKDLDITFKETFDFVQFKWGKKKFWIAVGK